MSWHEKETSKAFLESKKVWCFWDWCCQVRFRIWNYFSVRTRNMKYEICKAHKFQKIGRGTYQSGVGAFLKSRRRIYQWKSLNLNFLSPYDMTTEDIEEFKLFQPFIIFNESWQSENIWICKVSESYLGDICWVGGVVDGDGGYSDFAELRKGKL